MKVLGVELTGGYGSSDRFEIRMTNPGGWWRCEAQYLGHDEALFEGNGSNRKAAEADLRRRLRAFVADCQELLDG